MSTRQGEMRPFLFLDCSVGDLILKKQNKKNSSLFCELFGSFSQCYWYCFQFHIENKVSFPSYLHAHKQEGLSMNSV